ncbi:MAG: hypothetical protein ABIC36_02125 [bacterium]
MEKAIIINRLDDLKYLKKEYQRIYFGNEFCARLLPSKKDIDFLIKIIKKDKLSLSLLTSEVGSSGLKKTTDIIDYLAKKKILDEVIINDYGIFNYLRKKYPFCQIVFGRILSRSAILGAIGFLRKNSIRRIEFDNSIWSDTKLFKRRFLLKFSYYYPYFVFFNTRYCPVAGIKENKSKNHGIIDCSKECLKIGELEVLNLVFNKNKKAVLMGNTQFIKNKINLKKINKLNIDRLVFQPKIPI